MFECNKNLLNNNLLLVGVTMSVLVGAGFCWLFAMNYCSVIRRCWMIYAMLQCYSQKGAGSFQLIIILSTFPGSTSTKIALVFLIYSLHWSTKIRINQLHLTASFILHTLQAYACFIQIFGLQSLEAITRIEDWWTFMSTSSLSFLLLWRKV